MNTRTQDAPERSAFSNGQLVMWYYRNENKRVPVPAVVIRQEANSIVIKARLEGTLKELSVDPKELISR
jgi:hypothetical protein